jgi:hypothetical protein
LNKLKILSPMDLSHKKPAAYLLRWLQAKSLSLFSFS